MQPQISQAQHNHVRTKVKRPLSCNDMFSFQSQMRKALWWLEFNKQLYDQMLLECWTSNLLGVSLSKYKTILHPLDHSRNTPVVAS